MAKYTRVVRIPGKSAHDLYEIVSGDIENFLAKTPLAGGYTVERKPEENRISLKGSMFSGDLSCQEEQMELTVSLSLLASPFKSKLDEGVTKWLAKKFDLKTLA